MVAQHYRWDFIGLSSQQKPTPATSEKVVDGSTFYEADTSKLYVFCKTEWYEKESTGGGGGTTYTAGDGINITDSTISVNLAQTTGTDTKKVMSQDATTGMIFNDKSTRMRVQIGNNSNASSNEAMAVGSNATAYGIKGIAIGSSSKSGQSSVALGGYANAGETGVNITGMTAIGNNAQANQSSYAVDIGANTGNSYGVQGSSSTNSVTIGKNATIVNIANSVALGAYAQATRQGEVNIGLVTGETTRGYNSTAYRVIGGVHDGEQAHDAVTIGQINALIDAINSATNSNISHIGS